MIEIRTRKRKDGNVTVIGSEVVLSARAAINNAFDAMQDVDVVKAELMALAFADAIIDLREQLQEAGIRLKMIGGVRSEIPDGQTCLHVVMTGDPGSLHRLRSKLEFFDRILAVEVAASISAVVP